MEGFEKRAASRINREAMGSENAPETTVSPETSPEQTPATHSESVQSAEVVSPREETETAEADTRAAKTEDRKQVQQTEAVLDSAEVITPPAVEQSMLYTTEQLQQIQASLLAQDEDYIARNAMDGIRQYAQRIDAYQNHLNKLLPAREASRSLAIKLQKRETWKDRLLGIIPFSQTIIPIRRRYRRAKSQIIDRFVDQNDEIDRSEQAIVDAREQIRYCSYDLRQEIQKHLLEVDPEMKFLEKKREAEYEILDEIDTLLHFTGLAIGSLETRGAVETIDLLTDNKTIAAATTLVSIMLSSDVDFSLETARDAAKRLPRLIRIYNHKFGKSEKEIDSAIRTVSSPIAPAVETELIDAVGDLSGITDGLDFTSLVTVFDSITQANTARKTRLEMAKKLLPTIQFFKEEYKRTISEQHNRTEAVIQSFNLPRDRGIEPKSK